MTEKEMFIVARTLTQAMEDIHKGKTEPGPLTTLRRIRKYAEQYYEAQQKVDSPR